MNYNVSDLKKPPKALFKDIIQDADSQLLIPPAYKRDQFEIKARDPGEKMIGLFSSGTTAHPKCIWNSFDNLVLNATRSAKAFNITSQDRLLMIAKPWHVAGLSWAIMAEKLGCEYQFIPSFKGESDVWLNAIQGFKPDFLMTVPPVFRSVYNKNWKVENIITGGIPLKYKDFASLKKHAEKIYQGYGQTEAGGLISVHFFETANEPSKDEHMNCGIPIEGVQLKNEGSKNNPNKVFIQSETASVQKLYDSGDYGFLKGRDIHLTGRADNITSKKN